MLDWAQDDVEREYLDCMQRTKGVVWDQQFIGHGGLGTNYRQSLN
jgi:hypothetical protein